MMYALNLNELTTNRWFNLRVSLLSDILIHEQLLRFWSRYKIIHLHPNQQTYLFVG